MAVPRLKGMHESRPRGAPEVEVRARRRQAVRDLKYLALEPPKKPTKAIAARRSASSRTTTTSRRSIRTRKTTTPTDPDALVEDYEVDFARDLVSQAKGWKRREVLASSKPFFDKKLGEEQARIVESLKKLGIDWTPVGGSGPPPSLVGTVVDRSAEQRR